MKWQKKISKAEMQHLRETHEGRITLKGFRATREWQKANDVSCLECEIIARKLGIDEEG